MKLQPLKQEISAINSFNESGEEITFELQEAFISLPIEDVLQRLNETVVVEKFGEQVGSLLTGSNPMVAIMIFKELSKLLPNMNLLARSPACYWNTRS